MKKQCSFKIRYLKDVQGLLFILVFCELGQINIKLIQSGYSQQEQLRDLYPRLKVLAFGGTPENTLHTYFPSFLSRATPNCPSAMRKEVRSLPYVTCLCKLSRFSYENSPYIRWLDGSISKFYFSFQIWIKYNFLNENNITQIEICLGNIFDSAP